jgi:hypothetical protein
LRFPPPVSEYTPDGAPIIGWSGRPTVEGKRHYELRKDGYKLAMALLLLGFFLQLLDLLTT